MHVLNSIGKQQSLEVACGLPNAFHVPNSNTIYGYMVKLCTCSAGARVNAVGGENGDFVIVDCYTAIHYENEDLE